ncbi:S-layer homology domain-containing protein, partial [Paenibacillus sp. sgz500958]|uniref:S-layer homology domain-containing protein n=1 Tax=Paenibacillus sp. sgz500958 TaxID=3242475 RepID=UPI0036D427AA
YEYGIISGYGNGTFGPMDKITREQAMTIINKAMTITGLHVEVKANEAEALLAAFGDAQQSSTWSKESMAACIKAGIVSGMSDFKLAPKDRITRAEVAVIVRRLLQKSNLI